MWYGIMNWDVGFDPEFPEKFPDFRREDDEDEGGPWSASMALSQLTGLDGPTQAGQLVQTYMMTVGGAAGVGKAQTGGASRATSIITGNPNKD